MAFEGESGLTRRQILSAVAVGGVTVIGSRALGDTRAASATPGVEPAAEPTPDQRRELAELARRIRSGEGARLSGGIVVIDGWFLPPEYVAYIDSFDRP